MSDKRDNLDKIGTYSTIRLPFELNAEQLSKLPPGKELHFDRAKQTVRGANYCYAVSRACYRTERSRSVTIASKTLGKIFTDDPGKCAKFCVCQVLEGGGRNLSPLFYDVG